MSAYEKILDYLLSLPEPQQKWAFTLHHFIKDNIEGCEADWKYNIPFYVSNGSIAYITFLKKKTLVLGLYYGASLIDKHHILEGNQKIVRHFCVRCDDDVAKKRLLLLKDYLEQSIVMNGNL